MSGAVITARFEGEEARRALAAYAASGRSHAPLLRAIGVGLVETTQARFETATAPDGGPWTALNPAYAATKKGLGILRESAMRGGLQASITYAVAGDSVAIGSGKIYAGVHQFGATIRPKRGAFLRFRLGAGYATVRSVTIPARPYLGIGRADEEAVLDATEAHFLRVGNLSGI